MPEVGFDIPAHIGMDEGEIQTPCLIIDLDCFEENLKKMGNLARQYDVRLRVHAKMHKSVDIARKQIEIGGAGGICCQKLSEAEVFARAGIKDILITNQIVDPLKISRLVGLKKYGGRIICCVDAAENIAELSSAARHADSPLECLVELDCGSGRCGVSDAQSVLELARLIDRADGLQFSGIQAYHGSVQHEADYFTRKATLEKVISQLKEVVEQMRDAGLDCQIISGGGTGSFLFEAASGVYNEIQCGSYAFMDADYGRILNAQGQRLDAAEWKNALFILTSSVSTAKSGQAVCDAGLKVQSVDSGLPVIFGRKDIAYLQCSDEHGIIQDNANQLRLNDRLRLIPGHCDPTCNLHDWYIGVRAGKVESIWPVSARGKAL